MPHFRLHCPACGATAPAHALTCPSCGGPLLVRYTHPPDPRPRPLPGVFRWWGCLPLHREEALVSLGEGHTPLVALERTGQALGLHSLYGALEFLNPTGSFKDRGSAVLVSVLREQGATEVVEDSSGNAGSSLAAYCARAGLRATVFMPAGASGPKVAQTRGAGAEVRLVEGGREEATRRAGEYARTAGVPYASHALSPYFLEGTKTLAHDLLEALGRASLHVVLPVGNGTLLLGLWLGFRELLRAGLVPSLPRLHAVQVEACPPLVRALRGEPWVPPPAVKTAAEGIAVPRPPRLGQMVTALRETGGTAVAVPEGEALEWRHRLALWEGLLCETTSAVALAGLARLVREGHIGPGEAVAVPLTGSGLKEAPQGLPQ